MSNNFALLRKLALLMLPVLFIFGCDNEDDNNDIDPQLQSSFVRVLHLSPDAPAVDVWVDGNIVLEDVAYNGASPYLELNEGSHQITVVAAGTTEPAVISETVNLMPNVSYTVAASGLLSGTPAIDAWILTDDRSPANGQAKVRFAHASPDAPNVDIWAVGGTNPLFANVPFRGAGNYLTVAPSSFPLEVRVAGTDQLVVRFAPIALEAGRNYTVFAKGLANPGSNPNALSAYAMVDAPGAGNVTANLIPVNVEFSRVRVGHLSPDAPAVDVYVDNALALEDVPFRAFSNYMMVESGTRNIRVTPANSSTDVINANVTVAADENYSIVAMGLVGNGSLTANVYTDDLNVIGDARIRFIHASPDAPAVDITLTDGTVLFGGVEFNEAAAFIGVPANSYDLQVRAAGTSTVVLSFGDVALSGATNYSIFATGLLGDGTLTATVAVDAPGDGSTSLNLVPATAELRVAHLSPDAPNVDVYVDGARALENVPFTAVSSYLEVPAKSQLVQVFVAGSTMNPVIDATLTWLPGEAYTVAATGLVGSSDLTPIVLVDDRDGNPNGDAHVRFVHTSPDAPNVNIRVANGGPTLFENVPFRGIADYIGVGAASYDLEVVITSNGEVALSIPAVALNSSTNYTIFAIGLAGNGTLAALPVVDSHNN